MDATENADTFYEICSTAYLFYKNVQQQFSYKNKSVISSADDTNKYWKSAEQSASVYIDLPAIPHTEHARKS